MAGNENGKKQASLFQKNEPEQVLDYLQNFSSENLKKIEELEKFYQTKKISREFVKKHINRLWEYYLDQKSCKETLNECTSPRGIHYDFSVGTNEEMFVITYVCPKFQRNNEEKRFQNCYLICDFGQKKYANLRFNKTWIDFNHHKTRKVLKEKLEKIISAKSKLGLYIYGENGIGKTYITIAACNELARLGKTIAFSYVPQLIQVLSSLFLVKEKKDEYVSTIENLKKADILVLDSIGAESITDTRWFYNGFLSPILNWRMEQEKTTFFISNYSINDLQRKLTSRIYPNRYVMDEVSAKHWISRVRFLTKNDDFYLQGKWLG